MLQSKNEIDVYVESGSKRTFAGSMEWTGWCRSGRDERTALQTLLDYGLRYECVLRAAGIEFHAPGDLSAFAVIERLEGTSTTDFGAPDVAPPGDDRPLGEAELHRLQSLLEACWQAFDTIAREAAGKELRKGPRGGGRELGAIIQHVQEAEVGYLGRLGGKLPKLEREAPGQKWERLRQEILSSLASAAKGELPAQGPRGGVRWSPRYFVRRTAWHVLDHAWEIEDRVL